MAPLRRIKLTRLNEHLVCRLCNGYFVEATTISECLHTFCKTCIVRYLKTSSFCPVCDVQVHKTKPISGLREDRTLQDVVFKLVPNLFRNEMSRRAYFYKEHPEAGGDKTIQSLKERRHFFHVDDQISLSLEYLPPAHAHAHALGLRPLRAPSFCYSQPPSSKSRARGETRENGSGADAAGAAAAPKGGGEAAPIREGEKRDGDATAESEDDCQQDEEKVRIPLRRYLKCPAAVQVRLLEKFIRLKYNLSSHHKVDIVHNGDCLSPELTLLDVVYMYKWTEDNPLKLQYTVIAPPLPLRKRPRPPSGKFNKPSSLEPSPKKLKVARENAKSSSPFASSSPKKEARSSEEEGKNSPRKIKRDKEDSKSSSPKRLNLEGDGEKVVGDLQGGGSVDGGLRSKASKGATSPAKVERKEDAEEVATASSNEGCNSLNSSRDEADDAMVIDESPVTMTTTEALSQVVPVERNAPSKDKEPEKIGKVPSKNSQNITSASSPESSVQPKTRNLLTNDGAPTKTSYGPSNRHQESVSQASKCVASSAPPNSSIESLQALVNNSSYSGFPSKQGHQLTKVAINSNPTATVLNSSVGKSNASAIAALGPKGVTSQGQSFTSKDVENSVSLPGRPDTPGMLGRSSTPSTSVRSGIASNNLIRPNAPGGPVRPKNTAVSGTNTKVQNPKISNACSVSSPKSSAADPSLLSNTATTSVSTSHLAAKSSSTRVSSSTMATTNVSTKSLSSTKPLVSSSTSYSQGPQRISVNSKPMPTTTLPTPSLPALTSLTPALKTPLSSSAPPRMPPATQGLNGPPASALNNSLSSPRNPSLPTGQRLVSNSYRASFQMNGSLRMNGMMTPPRPVVDPTKPRLGRPPNSVRVAAGRMVPQPIVPRGANPREIYTPKSGTKSEGGRGRPKGQGSAGSARSGMNRLIAPHPSIMPMSHGIPVRPNARNMQPLQNAHGHPLGANEEPDATNGLKGGSGSVSLLNGVASGHTSKGMPQGNAGTNQPQGAKPTQGSMNSINGALGKEQKKNVLEASSTASLKLGGGGSPKTNYTIAPSSTPSPGQQASRLPPGTSGVKGGAKSPGRNKSVGGAVGNSSSILSIAQNLANKQRQQLSQLNSVDGNLSVKSVTTAPSTISPVSVAAAASLSTQLNAAATLGLNPAFCAAYMSEYAAVQNLISLSSLTAAARMNLAMTQVTPTAVSESPGEKGDAGPMDLSPTNKGAPNTALATPTRPSKVSVKGSSTTRKSPSSAPSAEVFKPPPILSPKGGPPPSSTPPSVPSPKPAQSPSPDSASTPHSTPTISPPTPEVTITKLPTHGAETPSTPSCAAPTVLKSAHTNTVSITKRPSAVSSAAVSAGPGSGIKYGVARSPSNASVRQIPNPSHLSHSQSSATPKGNCKPPKQGLHPVTLANNNNNNNHSNNTNKAVKVDL